MLVPHGTMILVADASSMRLLRNQAAIGCLRLQLLEDEKAAVSFPHVGG